MDPLYADDCLSACASAPTACSAPSILLASSTLAECPAAVYSLRILARNPRKVPRLSWLSPALFALPFFLACFVPGLFSATSICKQRGKDDWGVQEAGM